jgi:type III pantothenate kinase
VTHTAKLNRIDPLAPPSVIGKNTTMSMQAGLVFGYVGLIEGIVARMKREIGAEAKVIATGGLAELLAGQTECIDTVDQRLTLDGLRLIWEMNQE